MKRKNRIRPFKKVCAAVMAAALLFGGFGTSGIGLQAAEADDFDLEYSTTIFQNIPYIAAEAGVSIYINDPSAFAMENATLETTVTGAGLRWNLVVSSDADSGVRGLIWSDWSNIKPVSGTYVNGKAQAWTVQTGVSASNPITLSWTDAAQTQYGDSLDVKLVITGLDISYVGRTAENAWTDGNYGVNSDGSPRVNLVFMRTEGGGLSIEAYGTADASAASSLGTINNLSFGVDMDYHLEFYDQSGNEVYGTLLTYFQDLDIEDIYSYYVAEAKNGWSTSGVTDVDDSSWWELDNPFVESIRLPDSTSRAYAIDEDSSIIQYSGRHINSTRYTTDSDSNLIASIQAGVDAWETMTWTGSRCTTNLFESYSPGTGTITLTKEADEEALDANYEQYVMDPDLSGALYAVRQESEDGPIAGFFVTDSEGTGYVASASAEEPDDETAVYAAYTPEDSYTTLYYTAGSSTEMEVNEGQYYVEELVAPDGFELDTTIYSAAVDTGANVSVTSTDTFGYQQITLTKESLTADGSNDTDDETSYGFSVYISGLESGEEIWYQTGSGTKVKSTTANSKGITTVYVSLNNGGSTVLDIPIGAKYKITEYANNKIASYTVEDANSKGKIAQASGANTASQTALSTATETADSGEDVTVTFTNTVKESVTVTLKKTSVDATGITDKYDSNVYSYTIKIGSLYYGDTCSYTDRSGETQSYTITNETTSTYSYTFTLSLLAGETASFTLPEGATYKITEAANAKIPSYTVSNTSGKGTIVSASGQETEAATALSTATETAENGEKVTVTFKNKTGSELAEAGSLSFDANGGTYSDGTDLKTIKYDGDADGYEESDYTARSTNYTENEEASDTYAVPEREGYTFLGWASSADADTAYYTADYTKASNLAKIENMFPELVINTNLSLNACYSVFVPNTGLSDDFTWYYAGNYFSKNYSALTVYDDLMQSLGADSKSSLTALSTCDSEDDYYCSVTGERDQLYYYTSYNSGEYILPEGTYYCAYETDSGEVTTASITLVQTGNEDYFSTFSQTLYAVWEKDYGRLSLKKTADDTQNLTPDMDGALYAVHQDDASGEIVGYFITDEDGTGYAASADSADADSTLKLSVSYGDTTFYATGDTLLTLETGTYYVEELSAPDRYEAKDIGEVTVTKDEEAVAAYSEGDAEEPTYLRVRLKKISLNADGTDDTSDTSASFGYYTYKITVGNLESGDVIYYKTSSGTSKKTAGSSAKVTISTGVANGQTIWFDIPVGATYTIQETENKKIASYEVTDANADSGGTIVSASGANESPYTSLSTATETAESGEDVTVTFTNTTVEKVQVFLSKQSVDADGEQEDDDTAYSVYVEFAAAITGEPITYESNKNADNSGSITVSSRTGSATVSIQSGETITFSNVPVGAEYYFREESNDKVASYEITNAGSSGTVEGDASYANEISGLALTSSIQTAQSGEETTVAYTNSPGTASVQLLKVDEDGAPLAGAVFDLYDAEDELLAEGLETGEDGYTEIVEDLAAGDYYFVETDAPDGYAVTGENPIDFTITKDDLGTTVTVTVTDTALQILPNAGGSGIWVILLMSIGTACAAALILRGRRTGITPV